MGVYRIGSQRIGIVSDVPVLDAFGQPTYDEFLAPIYEDDPLVEWVDGCLLENQSSGRGVGNAEIQGPSVTTSEVASVFLPVVGQTVPLVDAVGQPAGFKLVNDITSSLRIRDWDTGREFVMRGDAVLQTDIRGRADHVECLCERERG